MSPLVKVTITRNSDGTWDVLRERAENGERIAGVPDLDEAFDAVRRAYKADGTPRNLLPEGT